MRDRDHIKVCPAFVTPDGLAELFAACGDCLEFINYEPQKKVQVEP